MCVIYDALLYEIGIFSFIYLLRRHMSKVCINVKTNRSKSGYICCSESVLPEGNHAMKSQTFFCFDFILFLASQRNTSSYMYTRTSNQNQYIYIEQNILSFTIYMVSIGFCLQHPAYIMYKYR